MRSDCEQVRIYAGVDLQAAVIEMFDDAATSAPLEELQVDSLMGGLKTVFFVTASLGCRR